MRRYILSKRRKNNILQAGSNIIPFYLAHVCMWYAIDKIRIYMWWKCGKNTTKDGKANKDDTCYYYCPKKFRIIIWLK